MLCPWEPGLPRARQGSATIGQIEWFGKSFCIPFCPEYPIHLDNVGSNPTSVRGVILGFQFVEVEVFISQPTGDGELP